ncbi:hypothetical protein ACJ7V3_04500 [Halomonas elongata]|uniref:hypothetical protein n=1 Tax=Halomonas elongata TaxID=2746 RepID=UPI0038D49C08
MKTVYIHIGQPKTATTSLQHFFIINRDNLGAQSFLYPDLSMGGAHHHLSFCVREHVNGSAEIAKNDDFRGRDVWGELVDRIEEGDEDNVIISSEDFYFTDFVGEKKGGLEYIKEKLKGFDVKVVCYLKENMSHVDSWYNEIIKHGEDRTCESFFEMSRKMPGCHHRYDEVIEKWSNVFGEQNVIVRVFDRSFMFEGDVLKDACSVMGIDYKGLSFNFSDFNERLTDFQLLIVRAFNKLGHNKALHGQVVAAVKKIAPSYDEKFSSARYERRVPSKLASWWKGSAEFLEKLTGHEMKKNFGEQSFGDFFTCDQLDEAGRNAVRLHLDGEIDRRGFLNSVAALEILRLEGADK